MKSNLRYVTILIAVVLVSFLTTYRARRPAYPLQVVDENGAPVRGAHVRVAWNAHEPFFMEGFSPHFESDPREAHFQSDADGRIEYTAGRLSVAFTIDKQGYYSSRASLQMNSPVAESGMVVPLYRVRNPQQMVGKETRFHLPVGSSRLQYDFLVGDLLPPHGHGVVADLEIEWTRPDGRSIKAQIPDQGNGVAPHLNTRLLNNTRSDLCSSYEAPLTGYVSTFEDANKIAGRDLGGGDEASYYLKIRSQSSSGPLYGKMRGRIEYIAREDTDEFRFEYVINPSGSRAMEMGRISVPFSGEHDRSPQRIY